MVTGFLLRKGWMRSLESHRALWREPWSTWVYVSLFYIYMYTHLKNLLQAVLRGRREAEHAEVADEAGGHGVAASSWRGTS